MAETAIDDPEEAAGVARALKVSLDAETRAMLREYANSHFPPNETTTT